jgi:hypothetical protein
MSSTILLMAVSIPGGAVGRNPRNLGRCADAP